ncbi:MAG: peptide deformylase [Pseudomonadota bacterium]
MKRPILLHPDPRLRKVCDAITDIGDAERRLAEDLLETMYDAPGLGLAAPQVGVTQRMLVMDCSDREEGETPEPLCLINPQIVLASDERSLREEGCLSFPGQFSDVERPADVRVRYWDADGREHERDFSGLWATCVQHEIDHLNGKLFIDHISMLKRQRINAKMKKMKREKQRSA